MIRFGTGGWRAIIGDEFTKENIYLVAQGFSNLLHDKGLDKQKVIIGHDRRFLSDEASVWFAEVLTANAIPVILMGRSMPTPMIMHYVQKHGLDFGIEITASHNPSAYNGIKIIVSEGRDAPVEFTAELEAYIEKVSLGDVKKLPVPNEYSEILPNPFNDYIDDILSQLNTEAMRAHGARLLFNPMHGSGMYPLMCILYTVRCTVDPINYNRDAYFGGMMPAPAPHSLQDLTEQVLRGRYELGIALDGDGDRLGIIDADGTYIDANKILVMLYHYLHEYKGWKGPVVRNLCTTHMLDRIAESFGEKCYEVPVGFKYISAKIDEVDAALGGESSGGLTVRGHIHGKDSVYAASLFAEMVSVIGKSPSEILADLERQYGHFEMIEANLCFVPEKKPEILKMVMVDRKLPQFEAPVARLSYEDGCKVFFEDGSFVCCRFSGTEPLLRIFAEASSAETAKGYIAKFKQMLNLF